MDRRCKMVRLRSLPTAITGVSKGLNRTNSNRSCGRCDNIFQLERRMSNLIVEMRLGSEVDG